MSGINIKIQKANLVCYWNFDVQNKECPLCKKSLMECPSIDLSEFSLRTDVNIGKCGHGVHKTCINSWIKTGNLSCPIDKTVWELNESVNNSVLWKNTNLQDI